MLRISIVTIKGIPPAVPLSTEFDERGGAIGRDAANEMALPDPERHLSRVQALVKAQGGEFKLVDQGGNPSSVNGLPLGKGNSTLLRDGDMIEMAEFILRVEVLRKVSSVLAPASPVASTLELPDLEPMQTDPLGLLGGGGERIEPSVTSPANNASAQTHSAEDPFSVLLNPSPSGRGDTPPQTLAPSAKDDPFAVFAARQQPVIARDPGKAALSASEDPFAAFGKPAPLPNAIPALSPKSDDPLGIGLGDTVSPSASSGTVDSLFGLSPDQKTDPFTNSSLGDPLGQPDSFSIEGSVDPLALLMGNSAPNAQFGSTTRNDAAILNDAFVPPVAAADQDVELEFEFNLGESASPSGSQILAAPNRPEPFFEELSAHELNDPLAVLAGKSAPPLHGGLIAPQPSSAASQALPPIFAGLAGAGERSGQQVEQEALLEAFAKGLGIPGLSPQGGMTADFMQQIGVVLHEAVRGTVELLVARAMTKREVRADVTMIVSRNNNPLKFSPDVNFALMQLLQPKAGSGFLPPVEAMRDAYDDLRAHQIGFMAGMRAALTGVLGRFKPSELEARLTEKSFLDSVLPANRKAKLWDLYEQRYADISREAEDNFHSLFGREFLRAYEEQIDRLQAEKRD